MTVDNISRVNEERRRWCYRGHWVQTRGRLVETRPMRQRNQSPGIVVILPHSPLRNWTLQTLSNEAQPVQDMQEKVDEMNLRDFNNFPDGWYAFILTNLSRVEEELNTPTSSSSSSSSEKDEVDEVAYVPSNTSDTSTVV